MAKVFYFSLRDLYYEMGAEDCGVTYSQFVKFFEEGKTRYTKVIDTPKGKYLKIDYRPGVPMSDEAWGEIKWVFRLIGIGLGLALLVKFITPLL